MARARDQFAALLPVHRATLRPRAPKHAGHSHRLARWTGEAGTAAGARDQSATLLPLDERVHGIGHPRTLRARRELTHWIAKSR